MTLRIATFNLENLDDDAGMSPTLADRIQIMRPQLERIAADILLRLPGNQQPGIGRRKDPVRS